MFLGSVEIAKAYLGSELVFQKGGVTPPIPSRLPDGYTEVEYIENTGNAYINTGITYSCTWNLTAQAASVPVTNQILVGSKTSTGHWVGAITNGFWGTGTGAAYYIANYPVTEKTQLNVVINRKNVVFSANGSATKTQTASANIDTAVWLFSASPSASSYYPFIGKIYGDAVCTKSGTEVFRGVPCIDPNNVVGMFDLISQTFKSPTNGTLIAGPAI